MFSSFSKQLARNFVVACLTVASVTYAQCTLDLDGDGAFVAATDGLLLARAIAGNTGDSLTSDVAISPNATRKDANAIRSFLATQCGVNLSTLVVSGSAGCSPDIDGDGRLTAAIDGLILTRIRRMADSAAIIGGIDFPSNATRGNWNAIRDHLVTTCAINLSPPSGPNVAVAGELTSPYPTINHLSVLWPLSGDANRNSIVAIRYRKLGTSTWLTAQPLRRVPPRSTLEGTWTYRHAGSIFALEAATTYEIEASLFDPDGGEEQRTIFATTRAIPTPMPNAPIKEATPSTLSSVLNTAQPGDVVNLASGSYSGFTVDKSGLAGMPIVIRSSGGAVVNGEIGIFLRNYIHIEGLTVNGRIRFNGSNNVSITRNTINATAARNGDGIVSLLRAENSYIADNVVNGLTIWQDSSLGDRGNNLGEGIQVTGPGHVIAHNRVRGMRDGISFMEGAEAVDQFSIDVLNNDIYESADDGIEADFCQHNCRVIGNRITNSFVAMSSQPSLGGPTYFIRNVAYNVAFIALKLNRESVGNVILHNTIMKNGDAFSETAARTVAHTFMRNNVFIGGPGGTYNTYFSGGGNVIDAPDVELASYDGNYDGFGSTRGNFVGRLGTTNFTGLNSLRANTTQKNAVELDLNVFSATIAYPANALTVFTAPDLRLRSGGTAVNAGIALPNINDGFEGGAPDLGAYEFGRPLPIYGPR